MKAHKWTKKYTQTKEQIQEIHRQNTAEILQTAVDFYNGLYRNKKNLISEPTEPTYERVTNQGLEEIPVITDKHCLSLTKITELRVKMESSKKLWNVVEIN